MVHLHNYSSPIYIYMYININKLKQNKNKLIIVPVTFEEEEEGTSVVSDVVKVEDEDPDTPGYLRGDRVRLGRRRSRILGASPLTRSR